MYSVSSVTEHVNPDEIKPKYQRVWKDGSSEGALALYRPTVVPATAEVRSVMKLEK